MKVLSYPELREKKGIVWSQPHIYRMIRAGKFPRPIKLGESTTAWIEAEIDSWLAGLAAERETTAA